MSLFRHVLDDRLDLLCCLFLGLLAFEFEVKFQRRLVAWTYDRSEKQSIWLKNNGGTWWPNNEFKTELNICW